MSKESCFFATRVFCNTSFILACVFGCHAAARGQGFQTHKLAPSQWAAFDHLTGDLATLDTENGQVHVYAREYFSGNDKAVRGPWTAAKDLPVTAFCFARAKGKTWIAVGSSQPQVVFLDSKSLEEDAIVRLGQRTSIRELNAPTDPANAKLFYQPSRGTGLIDLSKMKDLGVFTHSSIRGLSSGRLVPAHDASILYSANVAFSLKNTSIEMIGQTFEQSPDRVITDKQQRFASTGYAVLSSDFSEIVTEFDFRIFDFAADGSIVAGLEIDAGRGPAKLCLGSMGNFETIASEKLPAIFAQSPPKLYPRKIGDGSYKGHYSVFVDSNVKRVLVFYGGRVACYDYSEVTVPETSFAVLSKVDFPDEVLIGKRYEIEMELPKNTSLEYDGLQGITFANGILTWDVAASNIGMQKFRIQPKDGSPGENFLVDVAWPRYTYSFHESGVFEKDDLGREYRGEMSKEPYLTGLSADNDTIAVWYAKTLLLLDAKTGKQDWAHRFDESIVDVVFGKQHVYVDLQDKFKKVVAVSRDGEYEITPVGPLSGSIECSRPLVYTDGIMAWSAISSRSSTEPRITACSDATLQPIAGAISAASINGHVAALGCEFGMPDDRPVLLTAVHAPERSFGPVSRKSYVPVFSSAFYPIPRVPSVRRIEELAFDAERELFLSPGEVGSRSTEKMRLVIHSLDEAVAQRSVQVSDEKQHSAQIAVNDTHVFYGTNKVFAIPFSGLDLTTGPRALKIEHRQSTFLAERSKPTVLNYQVSGGRPPYGLRATCWLRGEKPDKIRRKEITSQDGSFEITFSSFETRTAATAFFTDASPQQRTSISSLFQDKESKDIKELLDHFTNAQTESFELVVGEKPSGVPVPLPIRIQVIDSAGNEAYLGHYLFCELSAGDIEKAVQRNSRSKPRP